MKATKNNLQKLVGQIEEYNYTVRYEKGNFQSGFCILEKKKVVVINKFFDLKARFESLNLILIKIVAQEKFVLRA
ncbi:MAG: hypothetical protein V3V00_08000 [Saprospiraceae bacterium]